MYQAQAVDIDPFSKSVTVRPSLSPVRGETVQAASENDDKGQASSDPSFHSDLSLEYDTLVYACGVTAARSKVPGVSEYCYFLKEVDDARSLRRACGDALERAMGPNVGDDADAQRAALTFVVVGGGPTGVEFAGELTDFLRDTVKRFFPCLEGKARVVLVHGGTSLLPQFDAPLRQSALDSLRTRGVEVLLGTRATRVKNGSIDLAAKSAEVHNLKCGVVVWSGGTAARSLTTQLADRLGAADSLAAIAYGKTTRNSGSSDCISLENQSIQPVSEGKVSFLK